MISNFNWIDEFISEGKPFAVCALPDSNEVKVFTHFENGTLQNDAGDVFNIQSESGGDFSASQGGDFSASQKATTEQAHTTMVEYAVDAIKSGTVQKVIISTIKHTELDYQAYRTKWTIAVIHF